MRAGSVLEKELDGADVTFPELAVKPPWVFFVHSLSLLELAPGQPTADRPGHVAPLVHLLHGGHRTLAGRSRDAPS